MSKWVEFVKQYAKDKGITYRQALKEAKEAYQSSKGKGLEETKEEPKEEVKEEVKEEPITMEIKEKKTRKPRAKKGELIATAPSPSGEGLVIQGVAGMEHIYPITHDLVMKMATDFHK